MKLRSLVLGLSFLIGGGVAYADQAPDFGGDAKGALLALSNPDEYAWQVFMSIARPALPGMAGVADIDKKFGESPESPMVWETWALESGNERSEVYKPDGSTPMSWDKLDRKQRNLVLDQNLEAQAVLSKSTLIRPKFDAGAPVSQEVRANRSMFETIVTDGLYNADGLERQLALARSSNNRKLIQFLQGAKEIKAEWLPIKDEDKGRYVWRSSTNEKGKKATYGLVALHIITKDLPNWVWIDFGHRDCEEQKGACAIAPEPAMTSPKDSTVGSDGIRGETKGTVWQNYRKRPVSQPLRFPSNT